MSQHAARPSLRVTVGRAAGASARTANASTRVASITNNSVPRLSAKLAALQLEIAGGAQRSEQGTTSSAFSSAGRGRGPGQPTLGPTARTAAHTELTGHFRLRWNAPQNGPLIDARLQRTPPTASATLVRNQVVLEEARVLLETPGRLRLRGLGSAARLSALLDDNTRARLGGGLVYRLAPLVQLSAQYQQDRFAHATTAGYFAPERVQSAEVGSYFEAYGPHDVSWAFDVGGGGQRYALQQAALGEWKPALHGWAQVSAPLGRAADIALETEYYRSSAGSTIAATPDWRYYSAALSLRWHI